MCRVPQGPGCFGAHSSAFMQAIGNSQSVLSLDLSKRLKFSLRRSAYLMLWTSKRPGFLCNCILWDYHNQFAEKKCSHRQEAFKNCCCPSLLRLVPKQRTPQHQFYSGAVVTHHIGKSLHPQPKSERSSNRAFCGPPGGSQQMNK